MKKLLIMLAIIGFCFAAEDFEYKLIDCTNNCCTENGGQLSETGRCDNDPTNENCIEDRELYNKFKDCDIEKGDENYDAYGDCVKQCVDDFFNDAGIRPTCCPATIALLGLVVLAFRKQ